MNICKSQSMIEMPQERVKGVDWTSKEEVSKQDYSWLAKIIFKNHPLLPKQDYKKENLVKEINLLAKFGYLKV